MVDTDSDFKLDPNLARDCHQLGELHGQLLLLMDNALVPWFILVPKTAVTELCDLPGEARNSLDRAVDQVCRFLRQQRPVDKLNVAAIGNVVRQLHVHVIGRNRQDYCWPGVVWGRPEKEAYPAEQISYLRNELRSAWGKEFVAAD
jgi:diadenosine tetraphosphate (Ap4A) HIT family hydrolase